MFLKNIRAALILLFCIACFDKLNAQTFTPRYSIPVNSNCNGFYEYLPSGYNPSGSQKYPLLIALHGVGERGDGSNNSSTGLPLLVLPGKGIASLISAGGFPSSFTVNSNTHRFIVICPQFTNNGSIWPSAYDLGAVVNYALNNYKVDLNRVYLAGLSMGAGVIFNYVTASVANASLVAAIVPVCTALQPGPPYAAKPDSVTCRTITSANLPVWATHNAGDLTVPSSFTDSLEHDINAAPAPTPIARKTIFNTWIFDHDAWTKTFDPTYHGFDGLNIYEWMLQYQRFISPLPVELKNYRAYRSGKTAVTISWQTENENNNDHFTIERSSNGKDFIPLANIKGLNQSSNYDYVDEKPLHENYYRLSQTDKDGRKTYYNILKVVISDSNLEIILSPNPVSSLVNFSIYSERREAITISISSSNGTIIRQWSIEKSAGRLEESFSVGELPKGTYFLQVKGSNYSETRTFVKM